MKNRTSRRPRVAIIGTRGYPSFYGGFETAVRHIAPALVDAGWDVVVYGRSGVTLDEAQADTRVERRTTRGIESKSLSTLSFGLTAVLDALFHQVDVALVMNVANGFWLPLLRARGIPVAINVDGIEWERAKWGRLAKLVFLSGAHLSARSANVLIADAVAIVDYWRGRFGKTSTFIPYGAEETEMLPVPLGLVRRKYVLVVARFVPENTIEAFFEAVPILAENRDVVIVGSSGYGGDLDQKAQELADRHAHVRWLGHLSDDGLLYALWQHAGAYFHGHSVGGTNPALVQAMALGAPIVALDTVYNREVLGPDHTAFTSADGDHIAARISALLSDPAEQEQTSERGITRARQHYSWRDVSARYEAVLRALVRRSKGKEG
ncbi:glycosyltransferase [Curtobacterium sp. APC 4022]|uniref:glycosyltransferase n=1 Tax=Curtobacterium sp. APC 4022 TaxID=3035201 RepID=UPI0025B352F6|nr:glycosyltransferase [Curtobacterium sp. APC 4022]MDN3478910.1 glycosyltransferase [Curtobacterium sp. APC 4022]